MEERKFTLQEFTELTTKFVMNSVPEEANKLNTIFNTFFEWASTYLNPFADLVFPSQTKALQHLGVMGYIKMKNSSSGISVFYHALDFNKDAYKGFHVIKLEENKYTLQEVPLVKRG